MAEEIEWRFLVTRLPKLPDTEKKEIIQAYFNRCSPGVRVRIIGRKAFISIKADKNKAKNDGPVERHEYEYEIPIDDAKQLVDLCGNHIAKDRYYVDDIELDVFKGDFEGLVMAEVEVEEEGEIPTPPEGWEWEDISNKREYNNQSLATNGLPKDWKKAAIGYS